MRISGYKLSVKKSDWLLYFYMGFFSFIIPFALVYWSEQYIASGLASVLFAIYPFMVALLSKIVFPDEKIGFVKIFGMILGFTGLIIIFFDAFGEGFTLNVLAMGAIVLSATMQATNVLAVKKYGADLHPLSMNLIPTILGAVVLFIFASLTEDHNLINLNFNAVASVIYLGVFGSVISFTVYYWLLKRISLIMLSMVAFITPIVAVIFGWLILNEEFTFRHLLGTGFVLSGILASNLTNFKSIYSRFNKN